MSVTGLLSYALEIPALPDGVKFYGNAGLEVRVNGNRADCRCPGQDRDSVTLLGGAAMKRLHHIALRAENLARLRSTVAAEGGQVVPPPSGFEAEGLWVTDPHGMLFHLLERAADRPLPPGPTFVINAPGNLVRKGKSGILPRGEYPAVKPLRLGHVLVFSPDVMRSVAFVTEALGMGLADRSQEVIAFCCLRRNSDHHVIAFAKSPAVGFHHGSFQVADPDEVGRAGRSLVAATGRGDWGFGRHTIGSNFFHYIQDPWGSWFEYYSDIDHIDNHAEWTPRNYPLEDSLANWGPVVPHDFVHNYEATAHSSDSAAA